MAENIHEITVRRADRAEVPLSDHAGKVLMIVNVASKCGLTPQYEGLKALHGRFRDEGFSVLGFPANDFAGQEPGTDAEIQEFCRLTYDVDFPVHAKIAVTGPDRHPLYHRLTRARPEALRPEGSRFLDRLAAHGHVPEPGGIAWNFEKFLIARDGTVAARFAPDMTPEDERVVAAIRALL